MSELVIEAKTENLEKVLAFVDTHLKDAGCPKDIMTKIDIAVEELFVNIAHYAYKPSIGYATIQAEVTDEPLSVKLTFLDQGLPYDPLSRDDPDITLSAEERKIGGLGIFMVKKSMDDISYEYKDGSNILTIKKSF